MIRIEQLTRKDWKTFSEDAHRICFAENYPDEWQRFDFALLGVENDTPLGYVTCREWDAKTLYWQFGGAFPSSKQTLKSFQTYGAFLDWCRPRYERITTLIENTNTAMLKMAMKVGFRITGVRLYRGHVMVEHLLELGALEGPHAA